MRLRNLQRGASHRGSIGLWERRTREYAEQEIAEIVTPGMVEIAESFMETRNAYDVERAMSLLADDGATAG